MIDHLYEIGTCNKTDVKFVYRELNEEMKNHPKYKLLQELYKEKKINYGNVSTISTIPSPKS